MNIKFVTALPVTPHSSNSPVPRLDWQTICAAFGLSTIYAVLWAIAFRV